MRLSLQALCRGRPRAVRWEPKARFSRFIGGAGATAIGGTASASAMAAGDWDGPRRQHRNRSGLAPPSPRLGSRSPRSPLVMSRPDDSAWCKGGLTALLCAAAVITGGAVAAHATEVSFGSLICSITGDPAAPQREEHDAAVGFAYPVVCSFRYDNGGGEAQYAGNVFLQPQVTKIGRSFIWVVRGAQGASVTPLDLAQTYTAGGTATAGTVAPLVPKGRDDAVAGLFTLGEPVSRPNPKGGDRRPARSDPVATLELSLIAGPT